MVTITSRTCIYSRFDMLVMVLVLVSVESAFVSAYVLCVLIFVGVVLCVCVVTSACTIMCFGYVTTTTPQQILDS